MSFCVKCGKELLEGASFCHVCGTASDAAQSANYQPGYQQQTPPYQTVYQQPTPPYQTVYQQPYYMPKNIVQILSGKVRTQAVIWLVIACIQYILGIINIVAGLQMRYESDILAMLTTGMIIITVAVLNTLFSVQNFKYSSQVLTVPVGIIKKYSPLGGIIGTLIYNVLFGGIIGIVGSVYAFLIRSFVMDNERQFAEIEYNYMKNRKI